MHRVWFMAGTGLVWWVTGFALMPSLEVLMAFRLWFLWKFVISSCENLSALYFTVDSFEWGLCLFAILFLYRNLRQSYVLANELGSKGKSDKKVVNEKETEQFNEILFCLKKIIVYFQIYNTISLKVDRNKRNKLNKLMLCLTSCFRPDTK